MATRLLVFDTNFYARAYAFADRHPHYAGRDRLGTLYHVSNAAAACGYSEVNADNIESVFAALEARAAQYEPQA